MEASRTAPPADDERRKAINAAFWDLGLRFQWDEATWESLAAMGSLREQLQSYLERAQPHLVAMYSPEQLAAMVQQRLDSPGPGRTGLEAHASF